MTWFKHDTRSRKSEKLVLIHERLGLPGIAAYWILFEMVAEKCAADGCQSASFSIANYSEQLGANYYQAKKFVAFFAEINAFDLVFFKGQIVAKLDNHLFDNDKLVASHSYHNGDNDSYLYVKIDSQQCAKNDSQIGPGPYIARACAPVKNQKPNTKKQTLDKNQITNTPPQRLELFQTLEMGPTPNGTKRPRKVPVRLAPDSRPTQKMLDYAFEAWEFTPQQAHGEWVTFRDYWVSRTDPKGAKLDWERTWRNWLCKKFGKKTDDRRTTSADRQRDRIANDEMFWEILRQSASGSVLVR